MEKSLTNQTAALEKGVSAILENQPRGEENENPFNRLPDELIISCIFDRLLDVRYPFMCSLFSRRFASLILQTQNIAVTIPCINQSQPLSFPQKFRKFPSNQFSFLKNVVISDSNKQGRLVVREEKIVQMRAGDEALRDIDANLRVWDEDVLKLPVLGFVMKNVRLQSKLESEVCHDELMEDEEAEEMGIFGEAVRELMKRDAVLEENFTLENSANS